MANPLTKTRRRGVRMFVGTLALALLLGPDFWVYLRGRFLVRPSDGISAPDVILVPGASVLRNGRPSPVLRQRVELALEAVRRWPNARVVLSGSSLGGYDEPGAMRRYLVQHGVDSARLELDRHGINTRSSIENLGHPNGSLVVVSQRWHLPRACWLAASLGWSVHGLAAGSGTPDGWENLLREHLVRIANFWESPLDDRRR